MSQNYRSGNVAWARRTFKWDLRPLSVRIGQNVHVNRFSPTYNIAMKKECWKDWKGSKMLIFRRCWTLLMKNRIISNKYAAAKLSSKKLRIFHNTKYQLSACSRKFNWNLTFVSFKGPMGPCRIPWGTVVRHLKLTFN
jgi:hypothetical protein